MSNNQTSATVEKSQVWQGWRKLITLPLPGMGKSMDTNQNPIKRLALLNNDSPSFLLADTLFRAVGSRG